MAEEKERNIIQSSFFYRYAHRYGPLEYVSETFYVGMTDLAARYI